MARYMYGDTELNHTLININDSTPGPNSAYSSNKTNDLLAAAASAAEATYFKKSDIQSSVNTSNNPPSSNAVTNALAAKATLKTNTLTAADSCVPPDGTSAVYSGTGDNAQLKATRNGNTTIQELQSADGNISTRTGTLNGTTWTWTAWNKLIKNSDIIPVEKGGTNATTARAAQYNLLNNMVSGDIGVNDPIDFVLAHDSLSKSETNGAIKTAPGRSVWNWIQNKINAVLGLTATQYSGNAASADYAGYVKPQIIESGDTIQGITFNIAFGYITASGGNALIVHNNDRVYFIKDGGSVTAESGNLDPNWWFLAKMIK